MADGLLDITVDDDEVPPKGEPRILVGLALSSTLLFSGLIFGWAPLQLILQREGQYSELCRAGTPVPTPSPETPPIKPIGPGATFGTGSLCDAQEIQLARIFSFATFLVNGISLPSGLYLDRFGPFTMISTAAVFELTGLVLFAFADSKTFDVFMPAYALLAVGGQMTLFSAFPSAFIIVKSQTAILAAISCLFDGSAVVLQIFEMLNASSGISRRQLLLGYAVLAAIVYLLEAVLWKRNAQYLPAPPDAQEHEPSTTDYGTVQLKDSTMATPERNGTKAVCGGTEHGEDQPLDQPLLDGQRASVVDSTEPAAGAGPGTTLIAHQPLVQQLRSFQFFFIIVYAALGVFRANLYIAANNMLLANYGDAADGFLYTKIFGFVLPLGFIFIPAIDIGVEQQGLPFAMHLTNGLGLAVYLLGLVPNLQVQVCNFLIFAGFRAFLYAAMAAFIAKTFGFVTLGRITGCVFTLSSAVNLLQTPLIALSKTSYGGSPKLIAWLGVGLGVVLVPLVEVFRHREKVRGRCAMEPASPLENPSRYLYPSSPLRSTPKRRRREIKQEQMLEQGHMRVN